MSQSLVKNAIHLIYSTKNRDPWLTDDVRSDLVAYQVGIFRGYDCPTIEIGGIEDHLHSLFLLSKNERLRDVVRTVKKRSSIWMRRIIPSFQWQTGYAAFSVSESMVETVRRYIKNQREHHSRMSLAEEIRELCRLHGIPVGDSFTKTE